MLIFQQFYANYSRINTSAKHVNKTKHNQTHNIKAHKNIVERKCHCDGANCLRFNFNDTSLFTFSPN